MHKINKDNVASIASVVKYQILIFILYGIVVLIVFFQKLAPIRSIDTNTSSICCWCATITSMSNDN